MTSEKTKITYNLYAIIVGNPVTEYRRTEVTSVNKSSLGIIEVTDIPAKGRRSKHQFFIKDASVLGFSEKNDQENSKYLLALLCSLTNPDVLFGTFDPDYGESSIEFGKQTSDPVVSGNKVHLSTTIQVSTSLTFVVSIEHKFVFDEQKILDLARRLISFNPFSKDNKSVKELNIQASIEEYRRALTATDIFECYRSLYVAFEKGVSANGNTYSGYQFDCRASKITGFSHDDIGELREFNNRLKHAIRNNKDLKEFIEGERNIHALIKRLKQATDAMILWRLPA